MPAEVGGGGSDGLNPEGGKVNFFQGSQAIGIQGVVHEPTAASGSSYVSTLR